jgi:hypothetical protein
MTQTAVVTKWKFVLAFEDDESAEISTAIGEADSEEECGALIEHEMQHHCSLGRSIVDAETGGVCAECDGEGQIPAGNGGRVICQACGGHLGPILPFVHLKI